MRSSLFTGAAVALSVLFASQSSFQPVNAADSPNGGKAQASAQIQIKAPPKVVWRAIHAERTQNPEVAYSKIIGESGNTKTIEQQFINIPILGKVTAVTRQIEDPNKRIDYHLLRSDKFKALEGSWELQPAAGGKETMLKLSSRLDVGVPFSGMFIKSATKKKIERRIANVKKIAEKEQARLAAAGEDGL